ncbi:MAG TPA: DUF3429 family protein [Caulobacter sp.]|nr:DUF3429 family protein [Caulobacter sp.]
MPGWSGRRPAPSRSTRWPPTPPSSSRSSRAPVWASPSPRRPATTTLCLSMAPPLAAWALVLLPIMSGLRLVLLALALLAHAAWDARADLAPRWYAGLRWRLTFGAMTGLLAGAVVLHD